MLDLEDERYAPQGGADAAAVRRALGTSDMQFWDVFLRETVQNSWDARLDAQIRFDARVFELNEAQRSTLVSEMFPVDTGVEALDAFRAALRGEVGDGREPQSRVSATMLVVTDVGTKGLGGPVRANVRVAPDTPTDFRELVRNIGRDSSRALGGGTYGFGKAVLYDASSINTCIIYTQTSGEDGGVEARLIAARLGERFERGDDIFTGRHWWGRAAADSIVDPLNGDEARELAEALGIASMGRLETGTSIAVLSPVTVADGAATPADVAGALQAAGAKWIWPHMIDRGDGPDITFTFMADGEELEPIDLSRHPIYRHYVRAFESAEAGLESGADVDEWPVSSRAIRTDRPKANMGQLAWSTVKMPEIEGIEEWETHHVALMRRPRLVVKYLPVAPHPDGALRAGVFIAAEDQNDEFARSEPAAHDDWRPTTVERFQRNLVKQALNRIAGVFKATPVAVPPETQETPLTGVAHVSRMLGRGLPGAKGSGAEIGRKRPGSVPVPPSPKTVSVSSGDVDLGVDDDGRVFAEFRFTLNYLDHGMLPNRRVVAAPTFVLDSGQTERRETASLDEYPEILGWYADDVRIGEGESIPASSVTGDRVAVRVRQPPMSATTVRFTVEVNDR